MAAAVIPLFVTLHVLGVVLCLFTLVQIWMHQLLLRLILGRLLFIHLIGGTIPTWTLFAVITAIAAFGIVKIFRLLAQRRRNQPIEDVGVRLRIGLYVVIGCVWTCVFLLSTPETFSGPFRVRHPITAWITASLAYGAWCALPRLRHRFSGRTRRTLDLIGMNVALAFVLAEVTLRVAAAFWANPLLITDSTPSQLRRDAERQEPGTLRFSFPINTGGHYDTEFLPPEKRSRRIVVNIGDSFGYGTVPLPYHYTSVSEREFPEAEVYNMGFPGLGPADYGTLLVEQALPLEPDLIVIALFVGNDVIAQSSPENPSRWYDADRYLVAVVWQRLQILRRAKSHDWTRESPSEPAEDLGAQYPWLSDPMQEPASMGESVYLDLESRNAWAVGAEIPGLYERFFANLNQLEEKAGDVPLAFLVIPDEFQVDDALWEEVVRKNDMPLERFRPQRRLAEWAREGHRVVVDLLPALREAEPFADGRPHLYHLRDTHFNARGNEIAGRELAKLIKAMLSEDSIASEPVTLPFRIEFGRPGSREWMSRGWSRDRPRHVWSEGKRSRLKIPLDSDGDLVMKIHCMPFDFPGAPEQRMQVLVNSEPVEELVLTPDWAEYAVVLPARTLGKNVDTLEFRYAYAKRPKDVIAGAADLRSLAVAWQSLELTSLAEAESGSD